MNGNFRFSKSIRVSFVIGFMAFLVSARTLNAKPWTLDLVSTATYGNQTGSQNPKNRLGMPGGGLDFEYQVLAKFGIEAGAQYLTRVYNVGSDQKVAVAEGSLGFNWRPKRFFFLDLGGYSNQSITNPLNLNGPDLGIYGGLGFRIPLNARFGVVIRGHYNFALTTLTYGSNTIKPSEFLISAGFSFGSATK